MSFLNAYWSPDYRSGIDKLSQQSIQSLNQLHDLRRLVFSYMNYQYSNSEFLARLGKESAVSNPHKLDIPSGTNTTSTLKRLSDQFIEATKLDYQPKVLSQELLDGYSENNLTPFKMHLSHISDESSALITLSSVIDSKVLEPITAFIKHNEPMVKYTFAKFEDLLLEYEKCYRDIEKLKKEFEEYSSLKELDEKKQTGSEYVDSSDEDEYLPPLNSNGNGTPTRIHNPFQQSHSQPSHSRVSSLSLPSLPKPPAAIFSYPIALGPVSVPDLQTLSSFLEQLSSNIDTTKRKIPLPGYKNESFSSDNLCAWVAKKRPFGINPTRVNIERFGQALIDNKIINGVGFGFIGAKKFKSEGMWFEWAVEPKDLVVPEKDKEDVAADAGAHASAVGEPSGDEDTPTVIVEPPHTPKKASSAGVGGILSNFRTSILKTNYAQILENLEYKYNELYMKMHKLRYELDLHIIQSTTNLEVFEKKRIEITYVSLTQLLQILYDFSLASTNRLHKMATDLINDVNKQENYNRDFNNLLSKFSSGIFFPSVISPDNLYRRHYLSHQTNSNFQNVKLKFNLFADFPLQPLSRKSISDEILLTTSSTPEFLFKLISILQERDDETECLWIAPLDGEQYWAIKHNIINIVNTFSADDLSTATSDSTVPVEDEQVIHRQIITQLLKYLSQKSTPELVNFLKYWFLEIGDSVIPFTYYDRVLDTTNKLENVDQLEQFVTLLSSLPRSNLSSLLLVLEHVVGIFKLEAIPNFGISDTLADSSLNEGKDVSDAVVTSLNAMDAIGAIPFLHLLLRPSAVKNAPGFKPPILKYNIILKNLLDIKVRSKLFLSLVQSEQKYISKLENEKKLPLPLPTQVITSDTFPKSPKPVHPENFTLRPFRTRATPQPSPSGSPRHSSIHEQQLTSRPRSSSSTFLTPQINIEFEGSKSP